MPFVYAAAAVILVIAIARLSNIYMPALSPFKAILNVVLGLIIVGIVLWLINTYIPMAGAIKGLLNVVVFLAACVAVLQAFGIWDGVVSWWHNFRTHPPKPDSPAPAARP